MKKINPLSLAVKLGLLIILAYVTQSPTHFYKNSKIKRIAQSKK